MKTKVATINTAYESPNIEFIRLDADAIMSSGISDGWTDFNDRNELF